jgi:hypothetical protein
MPVVRLDEQLTEELSNEKMMHDILCERYEENAVDSVLFKSCIRNRYLSEVRQQWIPCHCCTCEHPECHMRSATQDHETYHDCCAGDLICSYCYEFTSKADVPFCPRSRTRNKLDIPAIPTCLKLGFLEQRAASIMHCYVSILIVRGHQSAMKGQVVHCQVDLLENIGDELSFLAHVSTIGARIYRR